MCSIRLLNIYFLILYHDFGLKSENVAERSLLNATYVDFCINVHHGFMRENAYDKLDYQANANTNLNNCIVRSNIFFHIFFGKIRGGC